MSVLHSPRTSGEYLMRERQSPLKSEYLKGHLFAVAGASRKHNQIVFNLATELGLQLRGRTGVAYIADMRVKVEPDSYTYPDAVALSGEPLFEDAEVDTLVNPQVIIEVLSPSTEARDRGLKFAQYRQIPSLTDYILIAQDQMFIEHYHRLPGKWMLEERSDPQSHLQLNSLECSLSLQNIYDKVE